MIGSRVKSDSDGSLAEWAGTCLAAVDRGWKATLLGVAIVLAVAVGL